MADKVTSTNTLAVGIEYDDNTKSTGKATKYVKLPNPKSNLSESQIKTVFEPLIVTRTVDDVPQYFFGSNSTGALDDYNPIVKTAYTEAVETIELDLD